VFVCFDFLRLFPYLYRPVLQGNDLEKILSNKFQPIFLLQKSVITINFVTMFLLSLGTEFIEIQEGTNLLTTNISRLPNLQDFIDI
jgi:hypothetical protein